VRISTLLVLGIVAAACGQVTPPAGRPDAPRAPAAPGAAAAAPTPAPTTLAPPPPPPAPQKDAPVAREVSFGGVEYESDAEAEVRRVESERAAISRLAERVLASAEDHERFELRQSKVVAYRHDLRRPIGGVLGGDGFDVWTPPDENTVVVEYLVAPVADATLPYGRTHILPSGSVAKGTPLGGRFAMRVARVEREWIVVDSWAQHWSEAPGPTPP